MVGDNDGSTAEKGPFKVAPLTLAKAFAEICRHTIELQATIKNIKALLQIGKMLVQDPRTLAPEGFFLKEFPAPFFLLAVPQLCGQLRRGGGGRLGEN